MENPIIDINPSLLMFQVVNILILLWILKKLLYKPLTNLMESRTREIEEGLEDAARNKEKAKQLELEYQEEINKARQEARGIIDNASRQSDELIREAKAGARSITEDMINHARQEITMEKERAFAELRREISLLSVGIAGRIIEKEIDVNAQEVIVDSYLEEVGRV